MKLFPSIKNPKIDEKKLLFAVGKITFAPNDIVVIKTDLCLDKDQIDELIRRMKHFFPDNEVIMLTHGFDIAILSKEGEQKP